MLALGQYHTLIIDRDTEPGLFLTGSGDDEVLLPNKYKPESFNIGDEIDVFVYLDHSERPVATTLRPYVKLDEFAYLKCVEVSDIGAFLDWGLEKHLFVPYREMASKMRKDSWYLVFCYLDEVTERLVASSKTNAFMDNSEITVEPYEEVDIIVVNPTDLGVNVIVNELHQGLIYKDDIFQDLNPGDRLRGWIKKTRPDGKLDVTLQRPGYRSIEPNAESILNELSLKGGHLKLTDKSDPTEIQRVLQMSKKSFKKAIGTLYKQRMIEIKEDGIYLKKD